MIINHNIPAMNTLRQLNTAANAQSKSMEKLSSGMRINRAGDDAAGLAISEKMRGQIRGLDQASRNSQDGISLIQTAEGALNETHSMLQRMRELTVQANNGTNTDEDRKNIQDEIGNLKTEITNISDRTEFNKQKLIDGNFGAKLSGLDGELDGSTKFQLNFNGADATDDWAVEVDDGTDNTITISSAKLGQSQTIKVDDVTAFKKGETFNFEGVGFTLTTVDAGDFSSTTSDGAADVSGKGIDLQVGANAGQQMSISINAMDSTSLGVNAVDVSGPSYTSSQFDTHIAAIDSAIQTVSAERSKLGAWQNRLEHTINNLNTSSENLTAAESRVRDVDMAKEMMEQTKNSILSQAAQAMLAQANQQPQGVLQLLR